MSDLVIRAEGLGKKYLIGHQAKQECYATLREVFARTTTRFVRSAVELARGHHIVAGNEIEDFWALSDVSFEVRRGEVVGIIGRNGAGKSTLLKILSRITEPTAGRVEIRGRVASLLEVGTGFHPELTGRENIFLNAAILGMSRTETKRKFDEIVAFAETQKFLDTPVKRYSSGMYVRLAFAVAAHLEPEILVVDEVLAVGDSEFQKKCLGKMGEVAGHGRTVLFVSHNMGAIQTLCKRCMVLKEGKLALDSLTAEAFSHQLAHVNVNRPFPALSTVKRTGRQDVIYRSIEFYSQDGSPIEGPRTGHACVFRITFCGRDNTKKPARMGLNFQTAIGVDLFVCANEASNNNSIQVGNGSVIECTVHRFPLTEGSYRMVPFLERNGIVEDWITDGIAIEVSQGHYFQTSKNVPVGWEGRLVLVSNQWEERHQIEAN